MLVAKEKIQLGYIWSAIFSAIVIIPLTYLIAPDLIPFSYFDAWNTHDTNVVDWLLVGIPMYLWGTGVTAISNVALKRNGESPPDVLDVLFNYDYKRRSMLKRGFIISLLAGTTEEIAHRWLLFYAAFAGLTIVNFLFFGWLGFGIPEVFYNYVSGPIANITTFGFLHSQLYHEAGWLYGAALLTANATFRNGHSYQGCFGLVNSWYIGMYMFFVMFNYGLLAAIIIHFLYDIFIFSTYAVIWGE